MLPQIGISQKNLSATTTFLSKILADAVLLYTKDKKISLECFRAQFYGTPQII